MRDFLRDLALHEQPWDKLPPLDSDEQVQRAAVKSQKPKEAPIRKLFPLSIASAGSY